MTEVITSAQNPKVKDFIQLIEKSKERRSRGLFIVEGLRECRRALASGFEPQTLLVCDNYLSEPFDGLEKITFHVSEAVYDKLACRGGTEGVIASFKARGYTLGDIRFREEPLVLVLESVEKPGNIGAVLRTADAAGADAVIVCDPLTDIYNPNLIRASLGAIFSVPVVACTSQEACKWLKTNKIQILTAQLQDSEFYYDTDMTRGTAIVMGTEYKGLTDYWRENSDSKILIPMNGLVDSLNVSVSAAILCFEAVRQRQSRK